MNPIQYRNRSPIEYLPNDFRLALKSKRFYSRVFLIRRKRRKLPGKVVGITGGVLLITGELAGGSPGMLLFLVAVVFLAVGVHFELLNRLVRQFKYFIVPSVAVLLCATYFLKPELYSSVIPRQYVSQLSRFSSGFPFASSKLTVTVGGRGGVSFVYTKKQLEEARRDSASLLGSPVPFTIYLDSGMLFMDADIFAGPDNPPIRMRRNVFYGLPFKWDGNYDSNTVEVVSPDTVPVFQLSYIADDKIRIRGVFPSQGRLVIADEGGVMKSKASRALFYATKPVFRYPSWKYPHKLLVPSFPSASLDVRHPTGGRSPSGMR